MLARDAMTRNVISARPETPVGELARTMTEHRISGMPVIDGEGHLLGIVSDGDLLHRVELGTEARPRSWLRMFSDADQMAREFTKSHGRRARDVMSRHVVSVRAGDALAAVADVLDRSRIKRVPVLEAGKVVGIISRADLVRALAQHQSAPGAAVSAGMVQERINAELRRHAWLQTSFLSITVDDGRVGFRGFIASEDQRQALRALVEGIEGVTAVEDDLKVGLPAFAEV